MKIKHLITAITMVAVLLFAADWSMAHGEDHAGGHADAAKAKDCLEPVQMKGLLGMGYWENSCSYGVHVQWSVESDDPDTTSCESRPGFPFPCLAYVGANTRGSAHVSNNSGRGSVSWIACRAENFYSDPWPRITKVNPDKSVKFNCFHMGFGPDGQQVVSKSELEKTLRKAHGLIDYSLHQYKKQELARIEREQEREQARARRQWEEQEREWEREEAELAEERRQRNQAMWNQIGKSLGGLIFNNQTQESRDTYQESLRRNNSSSPSIPSGPCSKTFDLTLTRVTSCTCYIQELGAVVTCEAYEEYKSTGRLGEPGEGATQ